MLIFTSQIAFICFYDVTTHGRVYSKAYCLSTKLLFENGVHDHLRLQPDLQSKTVDWCNSPGTVEDLFYQAIFGRQLPLTFDSNRMRKSLQKYVGLRFVCGFHGQAQGGV